MNIVITALSVLSSITGFASGQKYDNSEEHLLDSMFEHFGELSPLANDNSILSSSDVYDMDGTNRFLLLSFVDGKTVIYDKEEECNLCTFDTDPYEGYDDAFKLLGNIDDEYLFAYFNEEVNDFTFINNTSKDFSDIRAFYATQEYKKGNYYRNFTISEEAHVIDNAFYFEKLGTMHAQNTEGTCAVIASEILFGYYDTFVNDLIVDEQYDQVAKRHPDGIDPTIRDFSESPGVDCYGVTGLTDRSDFHDYLCDISTEHLGIDPTIRGLNPLQTKNLVKKYMDLKGIPYQTHCSEGNLGDLILNRAKTVIKETIDQNRPVIASGCNHTVVAFAYDDSMVWVHTGWGYSAATPWSTFESSITNNATAGAVDIMNINNNVHLCSDNYYSASKNAYICPQCGKVYKNNDITPEDYGFSTEYDKYERNNYFSVEDENIRVMYNRTAILPDSSFISLSAKRENMGRAAIRYFMNKKIRRLRFCMAFFSYNDILTSLDSTIDLYILKYSETSGILYFAPYDDLLGHDISWNRNVATEFKYDFTGDEIYGFSIVVNAPATGNVDSGKVLIGNVTIQRSVNEYVLPN